ncbi:MAG: nucleotidyltransferase family protein [Sciscionella sp.]
MPAPRDTLGLLLAAGSGSRFGRPKALVELDGEPFVSRGIRALSEGGCAKVLVVTGAAAEQVEAILPQWVELRRATDWAQGMGVSLRAGFHAAMRLAPTPGSVLVHLVDLPGVDASLIARLLRYADGNTLLRAGYHGRPGNPVIFPAALLADVAAGLRGDSGARAWLAGRGDVELIECADLGNDLDVDTPQDIARGVSLGWWTS